MTKIQIKGPIVSTNDAEIYSWFGMESTSPKQVAKQIEKAKNTPLTVEINSGGGSVFAGSEIYTMLRKHDNVTVEIVGLAGSAASVIAMAGDKVIISPTGQIMIHNASIGGASGDKNDMETFAESLSSIDRSIAQAYTDKTGIDKETLLGMMSKETWLGADEAVEKGFADEVMFSDTEVVASIGSGLLPKEVINKVRMKIGNEKELKLKKAKAITMLANY